MIRTLTKKEIHGAVTIPASKSQAHRYLICAALSKESSVLFCKGLPDDILATIDCLNALGADIRTGQDGRIYVTPIVRKRVSDQRENVPDAGREESSPCHLYCKESGTTMRFMMPLAGALGKHAVLHLEGNLSRRPSGVFTDELSKHGMQITQNGDEMVCAGQLTAGDYTIPGNISSQFISGLLLALPLLPEQSIITISGEVQSENYITMTTDALTRSGVAFQKEKTAYVIPGAQTYLFPKEETVEGDWSSAAFPLCMGALSKDGVLVKGLKKESSQGDKKILDVLKEFGADVQILDEGVYVRKKHLKGITIDASQIPDMIPAVSAIAAAADGVTTVVNASRLRMKETDRLKSITQMLTALGADVSETGDGLIITGGTLRGGQTNSFKDHRIAMAAAVASLACEGEVRIIDAECVDKSYPAFWEDFESLR